MDDCEERFRPAAAPLHALFAAQRPVGPRWQPTWPTWLIVAFLSVLVAAAELSPHRAPPAARGHGAEAPLSHGR